MMIGSPEDGDALNAEVGQAAQAILLWALVPKAAVIHGEKNKLKKEKKNACFGAFFTTCRLPFMGDIRHIVSND